MIFDGFDFGRWYRVGRGAHCIMRGTVAVSSNILTLFIRHKTKRNTIPPQREKFSMVKTWSLKIFSLFPIMYFVNQNLKLSESQILKSQILKSQIFIIVTASPAKSREPRVLTINLTYIEATNLKIILNVTASPAKSSSNTQTHFLWGGSTIELHFDLH